MLFVKIETMVHAIAPKEIQVRMAVQFQFFGLEDGFGCGLIFITSFKCSLISLIVLIYEFYFKIPNLFPEKLYAHYTNCQS